MPKINNSETIKELSRAAGIQQGADYVPNVLSNQVVPVIDIHPEHTRILDLNRDSQKTTTGSQTIYTCPTDRRTFVKAFYFSLVKDATCDMATGSQGIEYVEAGSTTTRKLHVGLITLTAQSLSFVISLDEPIELEKGSTIAFGGTFTAGVCIRTASIHGYQVLHNVY